MFMVTEKIRRAKSGMIVEAAFTEVWILLTYTIAIILPKFRITYL